MAVLILPNSLPASWVKLRAELGLARRRIPDELERDEGQGSDHQPVEQRLWDDAHKPDPVILGAASTNRGEIEATIASVQPLKSCD